ncbi:MAG: methyl-accepting chemotaxis protein [bacterium]
MALKWSFGKKLFLGFGCAEFHSSCRFGKWLEGFETQNEQLKTILAEAAPHIEATIQAVRQGRELTTSTQEAFQENVEIAGKVSQLVEEIAAASQEQARGIEQISQAVAQMDKVVQATAANAEESASASEELQAQAQAMKELVGELVALVQGDQKAKKKETKEEPSPVMVPGKRRIGQVPVRYSLALESTGQSPSMSTG